MGDAMTGSRALAAILTCVAVAASAGCQAQPLRVPDVPYEPTPHHVVTEMMRLARVGASDVVYFERAGVPGVEFGPVGGGHHGPSEYVVTSSLETYRRMLVQFVQIVGRNGKVI